MPGKTHNAPHVTDDTFEQAVIQSDKPVLVDFHAEWCQPCKMLGPTIDDLAVEYDGRASVVKVDVDASPALAQRYGVQSIPTLLVIKGGEVVGKRIGLAPRGDLVRLLDQAVA